MACRETMEVAKKAQLVYVFTAMLRQVTELSKHLLCIGHLEIVSL